MRPPGVALAAIESALNRLIADGAETPAALRGRRVGVKLLGVDVHVCFHFIGGHLAISHDLDAKPDAVVKGTPIALAAAALRGQAHTRDIELSGDLQTAQVFESWLKNLDPDWEEYISRHTGDAVAFQIGEAARGLRRWGRQAADAFADDLRDYLQHEARLLPTAAEVDRFNREVDELRAATDRLEARARWLGIGPPSARNYAI